MEMTEIRKQSLGVIDRVDEALTSLAEQAKELLGYDVLQKHTGRVPTIVMTPLQLALKTLEIDIYNITDVATYQKERMIEQTRANLEKWIKEDLNEKNSFHRRFVNFSGPVWEKTEIKRYSEPIPEFVIAKAVQIKQAYPECELWVESLTDHPDPFLIVGIPNGRAYYPPTEMYYVEVWEEPKFEGHLRDQSAGESEIPF